MNMIRFFIVIGIGLILMIGACKRTSIERNGEIKPQQSFGGLKTSEKFNWNTNSEIMVQFDGTLTDPRIAAFKILDESGHIYYQRLQKAKDSFVAKVLIPSHVQNLRWSYAGKFVKFNPKAGRLVVNSQP